MLLRLQGQLLNVPASAEADKPRRACSKCKQDTNEMNFFSPVLAEVHEKVK